MFTPKNQKASIYNIYKMSGGGYILYNSLYNGIARLTAEEYDLMTSERLDELEDEVYEELLDNGFIISAARDERQALCDIRAYSADIHIGCTYTISVTNDCNARCPYCYERGCAAQYMDKQTAERVVTLIKENYDDKPVFLVWFGGEPLLNADIISYISLRLEEEYIKYDSAVVTNGMLINNSVIDNMKDLWRVEYVQISIDGLAEAYDNVKLYKDTREGAFARVMDNISALLKNKVHTSVRVNIDRNNMGYVRDIYEYFDDRFPFCEHLYIYPAFLKGISKGSMLSETERLDVMKEILKVSPFYTFVDLKNTLYLPLRINYCTICDKDAFVIDADGEVCKCHHAVGRRDKERYVLPYEDYIPDECGECRLYPKCSGGCYAEGIGGDDFCGIEKYIIQALLETESH